jgi:hypothetical protein
MKSFTAILICFGVAGMMGCLPEPLEVDGIPQLKPKIVVSTQLTSDQSLLMLLTKSVGALDASEDSDPEELLSQIAINDAFVSLQHDDLTYTFTFLGNGLYTSEQIPLEAGEEYTLFVESPTMGTVRASTIVQEKVSFNFFDARIFYNGYDTLAEISYEFDDPIGNNFYMFNVQRFTNDVDPEDILNPEIFIGLMNDKSFEGNTYFTRERIPARRDFVPGDTIGIFLSNISKEYFDFMTVRIDSRFNFSDFLGEPANYPSNVEGGLGFFNLYIPDVRILELKDQTF